MTCIRVGGLDETGPNVVAIALILSLPNLNGPCYIRVVERDGAKRDVVDILPVNIGSMSHQEFNHIGLSGGDQGRAVVVVFAFQFGSALEQIFDDFHLTKAAGHMEGSRTNHIFGLQLFG